MRTVALAALAIAFSAWAAPPRGSGEAPDGDRLRRRHKPGLPFSLELVRGAKSIDTASLVALADCADGQRTVLGGALEFVGTLPKAVPVDSHVVVGRRISRTGRFAAIGVGAQDLESAQALAQEEIAGKVRRSGSASGSYTERATERGEAPAVIEARFGSLEDRHGVAKRCDAVVRIALEARLRPERYAEWARRSETPCPVELLGDQLDGFAAPVECERRRGRNAPPRHHRRAGGAELDQSLARPQGVSEGVRDASLRQAQLRSPRKQGYERDLGRNVAVESRLGNEAVRRLELIEFDECSDEPADGNGVLIAGPISGASDSAPSASASASRTAPCRRRASARHA